MVLLLTINSIGLRPGEAGGNMKVIAPMEVHMAICGSLRLQEAVWSRPPDSLVV